MQILLLKYLSKIKEKTMAAIVLFTDSNFQGGSGTFTTSVPNLINFNLNDTVSSFKILDGRWEFYRDTDFQNSYGVVLGSGEYSWVEDVGIRNDEMSSLRPV
jgi:hypothetical protein